MLLDLSIRTERMGRIIVRPIESGTAHPNHPVILNLVELTVHANEADYARTETLTPREAAELGRALLFAAGVLK